MKTVVSFLSPFHFIQCDYNSKLGSGISAHLPKKFTAMFSLDSCSSWKEHPSELLSWKMGSILSSKLTRECILSYHWPNFCLMPSPQSQIMASLIDLNKSALALDALDPRENRNHRVILPRALNVVVMFWTEMVPCCAVRAALDLLPRPPEGWDYKHMSAHPISKYL